MTEGSKKGTCCFHDILYDVVASSYSEAETKCFRSGYAGITKTFEYCPNYTDVLITAECKKY